MESTNQRANEEASIQLNAKFLAVTNQRNAAFAEAADLFSQLALANTKLKKLQEQYDELYEESLKKKGKDK